MVVVGFVNVPLHEREVPHVNSTLLVPCEDKTVWASGSGCSVFYNASWRKRRQWVEEDGC